MSGFNHYLVEDCCNIDRSIIIIITGAAKADGLYDFPLADPVNGFDLNTNNGNTAPAYLVFPGFCYKLTNLGVTGASFDIIPGGGGIITEVLDVAGIHATDCNKGATCTDCNTGQHYIKADPCCDGPAIFFRGEPYVGGSQGGSMPSFSISQYDGVELYTPNGTPVAGYPLTAGQCYTWSSGVVGDGLPGAPADLAAYDLLFYPPDANADLLFVNKNDCEFSLGDIQCPDCNPTCYLLTNCDGTTIQSTAVDFAGAVGGYITLVGYTGSWFVQINEGVCTDPVNNLKINNFSADPCPCDCYEVISAPGLVTYIDCEGRPQSTYAPDKFCAQSPPLAKEIPLQPSAVIINQGPCEDGECADRCFQLINCDPEKYPDQNAIITSTLQSLYQYINPSSVVELAGYDGCWTVIEATCLCISVDIDGTVYQANYSGSTHNGSKVFILEVSGVTYYIWAGVFPGSWVISQTVGNDTSSQVIAQIASGILDCPIADSTVWIKGVLPDGSPVTAVVTTECADNEACDCPVDVTVTQDYKTCEECIGTIAYKLTNCDGGEVTYSTQDLFDYIGKIIKDDCHCWLVEQIDYQPPSNVTISNIIEFTDCASCLATFYQLTPCDPTETLNIIITPTNLSAYLNQVVQLHGCPGCYTVELYAGTGQPPRQQPVEVTVAFTTCIECEAVTPRCSTVFNTTTEDQVYLYIDVNGDSQSTEVVCSGHSSLRYCVQKWVESRIPGIFNYYGDCSVFDVLGSPNGCDCVGISITATDGSSFSGLASWNGTTNDGKNVLSFELPVASGNIIYYMWYMASSQTWYITKTIGVVSLSDMIGSFESTADCPIFTDAEWLNAKWPEPLQNVTFLQTTTSSKCGVIKSKIGECVQYFPNNRKVKPGYNTPICSSEKYDKITCNFAEIAYKEALALRYGISNCCPELDEKWLISKELIELQALQDPQFNCPPITDCCGNTRSNCSCNS